MPKGNGTVICFYPNLPLKISRCPLQMDLESLLELILEMQMQNFINYLNILTMQHPTTMTMRITAKMIRIIFAIPPDSTHRASTKS